MSMTHRSSSAEERGVEEKPPLTTRRNAALYAALIEDSNKDIHDF